MKQSIVINQNNVVKDAVRFSEKMGWRSFKIQNFIGIID